MGFLKVVFCEPIMNFRPGEPEPYKRRENSTWSGVYIGYDRLIRCLAQGSVRPLKTYHHTLKKPQGIWVIARKDLTP